MSATYTAAEVAKLYGCSEWQVYKLARENACPVPPIRLGRKLVWPKAVVDAQLGLTVEVTDET